MKKESRTNLVDVSNCIIYKKIFWIYFSNLDTGILLRPGKKSNLLNNMSILVSGASSKTPDVEQVLLTDLSGTEQQQQGINYRFFKDLSQIEKL